MSLRFVRGFVRGKVACAALVMAPLTVASAQGGHRAVFTIGTGSGSASSNASNTAVSVHLTPAHATQSAQAATSDSAPITIIDIKSADGALTPLLKSEAAKAVKLGKMPVVEFSAVWCGPCHHLANSLGDARMIDAFKGVYLIRLDLDAWRSKLSDAGFSISGIPAFFPINADGRPTGATITGAAWGEDIPQNMAPPLKKFFRTQEQKTSEHK